jgi:hypothetical protein
MGPRQFAADNGEGRLSAQHDSRASMGPRQFAADNMVVGEARRVPAVASMGPRQFAADNRGVVRPHLRTASARLCERSEETAEQRARDLVFGPPPDSEVHVVKELPGLRALPGLRETTGVLASPGRASHDSRLMTHGLECLAQADHARDDMLGKPEVEH